jgi:plasmid stabilization system protein ParE
MTAEPGFALHPLAAQDIVDIWEYIAADNPLAARSVREQIYDAIKGLVPFPNQGHRRPDLTSPHGRCVSFWYVDISLHMLRMKVRCGLSL